MKIIHRRMLFIAGRIEAASKSGKDSNRDVQELRALYWLLNEAGRPITPHLDSQLEGLVGVTVWESVRNARLSNSD